MREGERNDLRVIEVFICKDSKERKMKE